MITVESNILSRASMFEHNNQNVNIICTTQVLNRDPKTF